MPDSDTELKPSADSWKDRLAFIPFPVAAAIFILQKWGETARFQAGPVLDPPGLRDVLMGKDLVLQSQSQLYFITHIWMFALAACTLILAGIHVFAQGAMLSKRGSASPHPLVDFNWEYIANFTFAALFISTLLETGIFGLSVWGIQIIRLQLIVRSLGLPPIVALLITFGFLFYIPLFVFCLWATSKLRMNEDRGFLNSWLQAIFRLSTIARNTVARNFAAGCSCLILLGLCSDAARLTCYTFDTSLSRTFAQPGDDVDVVVTLGGSTSDFRRLTCTVTRINSVRSDPLPLFDAGDGRYMARFSVPTSPGIYIVQADYAYPFAMNLWSGRVSLMNRTARRSFQVQPRTGAQKL